MIGSNRIAAAAGRASAVALAVAGCLHMASAAEPAADTKLEEIVVTAERRATSESTTAISMNVLTGEDLASARTQNIADLQQTTPNVTINQPGLFNSINIRGIGNSAIQPSIATGVAVFQDGISTPETITLSGSFLDTATIEVLRGPQGTFIGASSTGGAIRINSVQPDFKGTSGYIDGVIGSRADVKITGAVNLPVSDTFAARIAFNSEKRQGWFRNYGTAGALSPANPFSTPGKVNDLNARLTLLWKPSDSFQAIWRSETNQSDTSGSAFQPNPRTFTNTLGAQTHSRYWNYDDPNHDPNVLYMNNYETLNVGVVDRHSLELAYTFNNQVKLVSRSAYVHNENQYMEDQDGSRANANIIRNDVGPNNVYYSQEFNLISADGPVNWVVGTSFFYRATPVNLVIESANCGISPVDGTSTPCPAQFSGNVPNLVLVNSLTTTRTGGIFGQLNWKFTDALEATLGARMNFDRNFSEGDGKPDSVTVVIPAPEVAIPVTHLSVCAPGVKGLPQVAQLAAGSFTCLTIGSRQSYQDNTPTWKLGMNYKPNDQQFGYAFWSRGYKSGGVDNQGQFDAEKVDDFELGWKSTLADGHVQLNLGGFWMDYKNMQQNAFRATVGLAGTSQGAAGNTVYNLGSSKIKGIEAEFNARFGGFGINSQLGYTQSTLSSATLIDRSAALDSAVQAGGQDLPQCAPGTTSAGRCVDWTPYYRTISGQGNIYSPKLSYTVSLDYDFILGNGASLTPKVTLAHTDAQDTNLVNRSTYYSIDKRDLLTLSVTYKLNEWLVQAYCNNCSDKSYIGSISGQDNVIYGAPRNVGLRARRSF
jgi:iron complex outermembrane receptor protein